MKNDYFFPECFDINPRDVDDSEFAKLAYLHEVCYFIPMNEFEALMIDEEMSEEEAAREIGDRYGEVFVELLLDYEKSGEWVAEGEAVWDKILSTPDFDMCDVDSIIYEYRNG